MQMMALNENHYYLRCVISLAFLNCCVRMQSTPKVATSYNQFSCIYINMFELQENRQLPTAT